MKRETFEISAGDHKIVRYKWNSAWREGVPELIKSMAELGEVFHFVAKEAIADEDGRHIFGRQTWQSKTRNILVTVQKVG